jgi:hypothetical protein
MGCATCHAMRAAFTVAEVGRAVVVWMCSATVSGYLPSPARAFSQLTCTVQQHSCRAPTIGNLPLQNIQRSSRVGMRVTAQDAGRAVIGRSWPVIVGRSAPCRLRALAHHGNGNGNGNGNGVVALVQQPAAAVSEVATEVAGREGPDTTVAATTAAPRDLVPAPPRAPPRPKQPPVSLLGISVERGQRGVLQAALAAAMLDDASAAAQRVLHRLPLT